MSIDDKGIHDYIADHPNARRESIRHHVAPDASVQKIWRSLKRLVEEGRLEVTGKARATGYILAGSSAIHTHLRLPYNRRNPVYYNRDLPWPVLEKERRILSESSIGWGSSRGAIEFGPILKKPE